MVPDRNMEARMPTTKYGLRKAHGAIDGSRSRYINISRARRETNRSKEGVTKETEGSRWSAVDVVVVPRFTAVQVPCAGASQLPQDHNAISAVGSNCRRRNEHISRDPAVKAQQRELRGSIPLKYLDIFVAVPAACPLYIYGDATLHPLPAPYPDLPLLAPLQPWYRPLPRLALHRILPSINLEGMQRVLYLRDRPGSRGSPWYRYPTDPPGVRPRP